MCVRVREIKKNEMVCACVKDPLNAHFTKFLRSFTKNVNCKLCSDFVTQRLSNGSKVIAPVWRNWQVAKPIFLKRQQWRKNLA